MTRSEQLELCKNCKNRNMDLPLDIYCSLHGDVPNFEDQCPDYEFSEKTQKKAEKKNLKEAKKAEKRKIKAAKEAERGKSKIIPMLLAIAGFIRAAMKGFEDPFGILFFVLGIGWLIVVFTNEKKG